jgi:hypothetical protein
MLSGPRTNLFTRYKWTFVGMMFIRIDDGVVVEAGFGVGTP